ncbi:hypothetical protein [Defluviimonas sp. SAOS-178_SWC]
MKVMALAFLTAILISVIADLGLHRAGFSSSEVTSGPDVRLD